jgi:hypothetical protein
MFTDIKSFEDALERLNASMAGCPDNAAQPDSYAHLTAAQPDSYAHPTAAQPDDEEYDDAIRGTIATLSRMIHKRNIKLAELERKCADQAAVIEQTTTGSSADVERLRKSHDAQAIAVESLTIELNDTRAKLNDTLTELRDTRDAFAAALDSHIGERVAQAVCDKLAMRATELVERDDAIAARDAMCGERDAMRGERDAAVSQLEVFREKVAELLSA